MGSESSTKDALYSSELRMRVALPLRGWYLMITSPTLGTRVSDSVNHEVSESVG